MMDDNLARKIRDPTFDVSTTLEMKLVRNLLITDRPWSLMTLEHSAISPSATAAEHTNHETT